ncbi:hypothetical protein M422DRAFT_263677 [Sphaerobolus stellatus SS14]|uniref:Uncharacterized protein n=1 Tax=Sphaerobolus stellatus (strain SS14) TaxID=990650 RepID=A0A0C9TV03_SPHS4|nr:hypothetical protein M422DRAFT_263677 [Sphaerobolus stellatus SS14]
MSNCHSCKWAEELSVQAVEEGEPLQGLTSWELTNPPSTSVDPQQSSPVFAQEHPGDQNVRVHGPQIVPIRVQSPIDVAGAAGTSVPSQHLSSDSGHNLGGAPDESDHASPDEGSAENEDGNFTIRVSEVSRLHKEYADLMDLKEDSEIIRTSMNKMSPTMKELFIVPKQKSSGKTIEPRNNWTCDKAATKAATEQIVAKDATDVKASVTRPEECMRLYQSRQRYEGNENSLSPSQLNIHHAAPSEQSDDSQP